MNSLPDVYSTFGREVPTEHQDAPVRVLTEEGDVHEIVAVEYDPEAGVVYLKTELFE